MYKVSCFHSVTEQEQIQSGHVEAACQAPYGTFGRHVIADLSNCDHKLLSDLNFIETIMKEGVQKAGATIITTSFHRFSPTGISGIILLSESHASIHTWPEEGYASMDVYTCGETIFPQRAFEYIAERLNAQATFTTIVERGLPSQRTGQRTTYVHQLARQELLGA